MTSKKQTGVAFFEGNSWYHRVKLLQEDGTIKYSKRGGFESEKDAEKSYYKYEETFKKAYRTFLMGHKTKADIGFKDYLIYWFEEVYSKRIEPTTRMVGAYTLYDLILPNLDQDIKLRYASTEYLDSLLLKASKTCKSAGNKSRELLNLAMKDAVIQGEIKHNPVTDTKAYPRNRPSITILSKEKLKRFLGVVDDSAWKLEIFLALFCGLRKGEILGLKFGDVDFEKGTVHIQRQITANPIIPKGQSAISEHQVVEKAPKTENSDRILKLPQKLIQELKERRRLVLNYKEMEGENFIDRDYVSCQKNGLPHSVTAMNSALTKLCVRNGLPHVSVHGLRHMYATILLEQGVRLVKISALLGHSSVSTTFEFYCDQMDEYEKIISFMNSNFIPEECA